MKVLWFCSSVFSSDKITTTGTWLHTMSHALVSHGVELYNMAPLTSATTIYRQDYGSIRQWVLPRQLSLKNGLPREKWIREIQSIVDEIRPDLIHYWGVEYFYPLLYSRHYLEYPSLLEIQGIKETCARVFYGNLTCKELLRTYGVKEITFLSSSLLRRRQSFKNWGRFEREMLSTHINISTHSEWVRAWVNQYVRKDAKVFHTHRIVRQEFLNAKPWTKPRGNHPVLFAISAGPDAYKGIHDAIKALNIIKRDFPNVELRIAGNFEAQKKWYRRVGYTNFLLHLINKYNLNGNVTFLDRLNAEQINEEMHHSDIMLQLSYVETYSLAVAEAVTIGIPAVIAFAGATPELIGNSGCSLFFTPSDYFMCAHQVKRILSDDNLSDELSKKTQKSEVLKFNPEECCLNQISIYNSIINKY